MVDKDQILNQAEDLADQVLRQGKHVLPHLARLFIVSTFLEDGIRMYFQWGEQRDFMNETWNSGWFLSSLFVLINLLGQIGGCLLVLSRKWVEWACLDLFLIIILQSFAYSPLWDLKFFLKNLALVGGVILLLVETQQQLNASILAGLPSLGDNKQKTILQLGGRILLILISLTIIKFDFIFFYIIQNFIIIILVIFITVGFKTKLCCLLLSIWLFITNCYMNSWWMLPSSSYHRDFLKYDFFQTLSVIGGFLLVVALGPGGYSIDEKKKRW